MVPPTGAKRTEVEKSYHHLRDFQEPGPRDFDHKTNCYVTLYFTTGTMVFVFQG